MTAAVKRKLTTILCADAKGYSHLMEEDERGTFDTLRRHREAMSNLISRHDGRVVNTWGDAVLAEFPSVVESVQCAIEVQRELADHNSQMPDDKRLQFRIGINLGDVMVENEDLYGEGVNIASRLQEIAEPGGIAISRTVHDQVRHKMPIGFDYIGEQSVKNVAEPVPIYRVAMQPSETIGAAASVQPTHTVSDLRNGAVRMFRRFQDSTAFRSLYAWWDRQSRWVRITLVIIGVILVSNVLLTLLPMVITIGLVAIVIYLWPQITRRNDKETAKLSDRPGGTA